MSVAVILVECLLLLSIVASCQTSWAQFSSGIEGTVTDPSGAVLPGVRVTSKNEGTGFAQSLQTQDTGYYRVLPVHNPSCGGLHAECLEPGIPTAASEPCRNSRRKFPHNRASVIKYMLKILLRSFRLTPGRGLVHRARWRSNDSGSAG